MKMRQQWRILLVLPLIALQVCCVRICELRDERVFCQCDGYEVDKVRTVTCNFISNITGEDEIWSGFEEQRNVEFLSLNGRGGGSLITVPVRALQITRHMLEVMFTGNRLGILKSNSFADMDKLSRIDLEQNEITGLEENTFSNLPNLTTLVLSENNLKYLPAHTFQRLPNLKELFLDRNNLESIADHAFQHLHGLVELDFNSNKLGHISSKTFVGLRALKRLDLSRNSLTSLKDRIFRSSSDLLDLDLSRNRITEITPHAFDGLKRLQKLNLKDNKLHNLQKTIFKGATHLIQINLGDNKLVTLQKHILDPLVNVSNPEFVITLKGNPFECRCDLLWISSFVNNSKTHSESLGLKKELKLMKCTFSEHRKSTPVSVIDLRRDEMICPDPPIVKHQLHAPLHTSLLQKAPSTTTTISSVTTEQTSVIFPRVHTLSAIAEDNRVELYNYRCLCSSGYEYVPEVGNCFPGVSRLYGACAFTEQCSFHGAICRQGFCECQPKFWLDTNSDSCVQEGRSLGETCELDRHCKLRNDHSVCSKQMCTCTVGWKERNGLCVLISGSGTTSRHQLGFLNTIAMIIITLKFGVWKFEN